MDKMSKQKLEYESSQIGCFHIFYCLPPESISPKKMISEDVYNIIWAIVFILHEQVNENPIY